MIVRHGNVARLTLFAALVTVFTIYLGAAPASTRGRRTRPAGMAKPSGGLVEKAYSGRVIRVVDAQSAMPSNAVAEAVGDLRVRSQMPLSLVSAPPADGGLPLQAVSSALREPGVGAAVVLVAAANLPLVTASPDGRWAVLNAAPLTGDPARGADRLGKLLWGAVSRALGAGWSGEAASVLAPCADARGLDALPAAPSPAEQNAAVDAARARGIGMLTFATYRTACAQGWAPAPTNDVQRAIWDEVRAIPSEPMKIEFDPKRGR